jgi:hypothetical protein
MGGEHDNQTINYPLLFERVMWRYSLVAQAPAASVGNETSQAKPGSREPKNPFSPVDRLRFHFEACHNDEGRRRVIREALDELYHATHSKKPDLVRGTAEWKRSLRNDPSPPGVVAHTHGVDLATVYRWRKKSH